MTNHGVKLLLILGDSIPLQLICITNPEAIKARHAEELNYSPMDGMRQSIDSDVVGSNPSEKSNFSLRASSSGETH